ncbi:lysozyme inhibitor LprI family protein [Pseudomonas sp. NPDC089554]|uniref:lysozyme inhibitor LprI family protein n=1 Tax=Pseudomonas sp. NPDC089554 TaxID=3390653 RepID=UPI003D030B6C
MKSKAWLALLAAVALGAQAAEEESTPCDNVDSEQQEYACAAYNKQAAERGLKEAFDELVLRVRDQYADEGAQAESLVGKLQAAQKLWTQLRDADCKVETFAEKPGNKAFEAAWNTCLAQRSDDRSEYLQSIGQQ